MKKSIYENYFLVLFSIIPISILLGPAISLINILVIDLSFIIFAISNKKKVFYIDKNIKIMFLISIYLIFNSIISIDFSLGALRNFGFIRFIILFIAFNYFFYDEKFFNKVIFVWSIVLLIVAFDIYVERFTGTNILGFGANYIDGIQQPDGNRIVSFFKDEPIAGSYINAFFLIIVGFFFTIKSNFSKKYKITIPLIMIFFITAVLLTGERSNTIKAFLGFFIFFSLSDIFNLKKKIIFFLSLFLLIGTIYNGSEFLKMRYSGQFIKPIMSIFESKNINAKRLNSETTLTKNIYYRLYDSGFSVFKSYPLFGVGNKNYRLITCEPVTEKYECNTHPHQFYFELLAEHGLIGSFIIIFALFNLTFSKIKLILVSKNHIQIGCLIFLSTSLIPLLPSGAFFSDNSLTVFWINLSILYSVSKKTNMYSVNQSNLGTVAQ
ncbi:O-antigen polymerase [Candidatus Pelagibacter sp. Uisw_092]|uniref:O-antigen ligase family protein n=1 Tax=Candidatus Pelagibacter sp. Uisw_092 TaxID=3230979 RepID=UPI0039E78A66